MAALTEGKVSLADRFFCTGYDPVYNKKKCWTVGKREPHGLEDIIAGFKNSCNIVFYDLGRRLGPDILAKYARMFGLGKKPASTYPGNVRVWCRTPPGNRGFIMIAGIFRRPWTLPSARDS